jgi:hypothetical protein
MALNATTAAPQDGARIEDARKGSAGAEAASVSRFRTGLRGEREVRVYQHSNLLYWWVVWAYGFLCAGITYLQGIGIKELAAPDKKEILFHPSPWLGISFIALMLFVVVFTNVRARGVYSFVLLLVAGGLLWGAMYVPGIDMALGWVSLVRVHLNLAFYLAFSFLLLVIWLFVIVFVDRFTWWRFSPGQVIEEHRVGQATGHAYNTEGMIIRRLPDDLFRHRVMGFGTGDFVVKPANGESFEIHNVPGANKIQRTLEHMIATRSVSGV